MKVTAVALAALAVVFYIWARLLPLQHTVRLTRDFPASPERVFSVITAFTELPKWRSGMKSVTYDATRRRVVETNSMGVLPYLIQKQEGPHLLVTRIDGGQELGFGGTWTYGIEPAPGGGTRLTITEEGEVPNLMFRWMARYVFGHERTLRTYLDDLGRYLLRS